jgi:hypothetical protein
MIGYLLALFNKRSDFGIFNFICTNIHTRYFFNIFHSHKKVLIRRYTIYRNSTTKFSATHIFRNAAMSTQ